MAVEAWFGVSGCSWARTGEAGLILERTMTEIGSNSNAQLRSVVERIERLGTEIKEMREDQNEVYAEAKGNGYDVKVLRKIIAIRKKDPAAREEEATLLDTYMSALGMQA